MMRSCLIGGVCLAILLIQGAAFAQTVVNSHSGRNNGLVVASKQEVVVKPTILRCFTTLQATDADAKQAVLKLIEKKTETLAKLQAIGVRRNDLQTTKIRIADFQGAKELFWTGSETSLEIPKHVPTWYDAYLSMQIDWAIKEDVSDELILLPIDVVKQFREHKLFLDTSPDKADHFESEVHFLFVGAISEKEADAATKRAYVEANAHAEKLAQIAGKKLDKLTAFTPQINGKWSWWFQTDSGYGISTRSNGIPHPMTQFAPAPSEVYGTHPSNLTRTFTIELQYELK